MARYIDVDKAILQLRGWCVSKYPSSFCCGILASADEISKMPTVDIEEVKRGTWKINFDGYYPYCSECGHEPKGRHPTEYCEKCGAEMINYNELKKE